ncbi:MAG: hypothetical protein GYB67_06980 [Chloroflexi bacterium]|nr:hypothetical protein [Chloroflexota bacterium]
MNIIVWVASALLIGLTPVGAQSDPVDLAESAEAIRYGQPVTGSLSFAAPRAVYTFEALRGEVLAVTLTVTAGTLDPVLTVLDPGGVVLDTRDDSAGARGVTLPPLTIPASGTYTVIVARFGMRLGSTAGDYVLTVERVGVSSASGSALRYGDSIINSITDLSPQMYYSFRAERGDIVSVRMQRASGDLDPSLQIVYPQPDRPAQVVAENDDTIGSNPLDAAIDNLLIQESGTYVIVATRYGQESGRSRGEFVLTLTASGQSGLGARADAAIRLEVGEAVSGELTPVRDVQFYRFEGRRDDVVAVRMDRTSGNLDPLIAIADVNLNELIVDDDGGSGQNAAIQRFVLPANGTYYVIATRYQRADGTTTGGYSLTLERLGNLFDGVVESAPQLQYGSTITGAITPTETQQLYLFAGAAGDAITISLSRAGGNLDPVVALLDENFNLLTSDDDGGNGQNSLIERYELPADGLYYIQATRYTGTTGDPATTGAYVLVLAQRFD